MADLTVDLLTFQNSLVDPSNWPKLSCAAANQLALEASSLRLDRSRELVFRDSGQIRCFDDHHRLVFNRPALRLELHEQGDISFLTGGPPPVERMVILANGNVGIGVANPGTPLEVAGFIRATDGLESNVAKKMQVGTRQAQPLELVTNNNPVVSVDAAGKVGIGTTTPEAKLDVRGEIRAGNSDLYFTKTDHNHTGIGNAAGFAAIENAASHNALMILGRAGTSKGRSVRLWDCLEVNGPLDVKGDIGFGSTLSTGGRMHLTGGEALYLLNKDGVIVSKAWGGNGNLNVEGDVRFGSILSTDGRMHITGGELLYLLHKNGVIIGNDWGGSGDLTVKGVINGRVVGPSDARLKVNITPLDNVLEKLAKVRAVSFNWNELASAFGRSTEQREIGVIAQDLEAAFPEVITTLGDENYKAIDYSRLTAVFIEAAKELLAKNEALARRVEELESITRTKVFQH